MTRSYLSSKYSLPQLVSCWKYLKKRKTTPNSFYNHYTSPGALTAFLSHILEFFNISDTDQLCSRGDLHNAYEK